MAGFIYIMSNPAFSTGLVKIGKSDRDPELHRKFELETTGVPSPFYVEYYAFVSDHHSLERQLHHKYAKFRLNHSREFFHVPIAELIIEIRSSGNVIHEKVNFKSPEEIKKAQIEKEKLASQAIAKKQREKDDNERRKKEEQLEVKRQEAIEKTHEIINTHANSYKWMNFHIRPENKFAIIFAFILSAILTAIAGPIGIFLLICILFGLSPQLVLDLLYDNKAYALGILLEENNFRSIHEHVLSGRDPSDIIRGFLYKNHQQIKSELRAQAQVASSNNKFTLPERDREKNYQQTEKLRNNNQASFPSKINKRLRQENLNSSSYQAQVTPIIGNQSKANVSEILDKIELVCKNCQSSSSHIYDKRRFYLRCQLCSYESDKDEIDFIEKLLASKR